MDKENMVWIIEAYFKASILKVLIKLFFDEGMREDLASFKIFTTL